MKNALILFMFVCTLGFTVYCGISYVNMHIEKNIYRLNYESMREELESYYRTQARGIDPAFTCKFKVKNGD